MREETLRMERVTYREQGVTQLENFSMSIWAGEIMGLMPVNRHGISALIKLLRQNLPLHYGYVYYHEKQVNHWRYSDSSMNRISVIQNKSCLAEGLTVADNICAAPRLPETPDAAENPPAAASAVSGGYRDGH